MIDVGGISQFTVDVHLWADGVIRIQTEKATLNRPVNIMHLWPLHQLLILDSSPIQVSSLASLMYCGSGYTSQINNIFS